jgi:hypothetical protein
MVARVPSLVSTIVHVDHDYHGADNRVLEAVTVGDSFTVGCCGCFMLLQDDDHLGGTMFLFWSFWQCAFLMSLLVS